MPTTGVYIGCTLTIKDHKQDANNNMSNSIVLDNFIYGMGDVTVCFDPTLTISQDECLALKDLYDSTAGASWLHEGNANTSDDWFETSDASLWYGLTVQSGHVIALDLHDDNLVGSFPDLGALSRVQTLRFDQNALSGNIV